MADTAHTPHTILIVDDKLENLDVLIAYLERFDFRFLVARSGEEMLKRMTYVTPDIILLDVMMPGMDGFEACRRLKADDRFRDIPVIFMTALTDTTHKVKGFELGAVDYITKPFQQEEVLARVRAHLTIQQLQNHLHLRNQELQAALDREHKLIEDLRLNLSLSLPHELRTPLTGIIGFSSFLTDQDKLPVSDQIVRFGTEIHRNGLRLNRLVENSLLYAHLKLLRYVAEKDAPRPHDTMLQTRHFVATVAQQSAKDAGRLADLHLNLVEASLTISPKNFEKILTELLNNAFKFSAAGAPVNVAATLKNDRYQLSITDQGNGMTAEQIASIGAYLQFDRQRYEQQGLGLGLIIAHLLTRMEEGELTIASDVQRGTTVTLDFKQAAGVPTIDAQMPLLWFEQNVAASLAPTDPNIFPVRSPAEAAAASPHFTIVVVSAIWENRAVIVQLLTPLGIDVIEAFDYVDGLQKTQKYQPDLVLMEPLPPEAEQENVAHQFHKAVSARSLKILMIAAASEADRYPAFPASPYAAVLTRPVKIQAFLEILKHHLGVEWIEAAVPLTGTNDPGRTRPPSVVTPPPAVLHTLHELVLDGDIVGIWKQLEQIQQLDARYLPFVEQLRGFVKAFHIHQLREELEQQMQRNAAYQATPEFPKKEPR